MVAGKFEVCQKRYEAARDHRAVCLLAFNMMYQELAWMLSENTFTFRRCGMGELAHLRTTIETLLNVLIGDVPYLSTVMRPVSTSVPENIRALRR